MDKSKVKRLADYAVRQCQGDPLSLLSVLGCNFYDDHETEHHHEPANESSDEDETQALSM